MPLKPNIIIDVDGVILEWTRLGSISEEEKYEKLNLVSQLPNVFEAINKLRENYRINFCTARSFKDADLLTFDQLSEEPGCLLYPEDTLLVGVPSEYKCHLIQPLQAKVIIDDHPSVIQSTYYEDIIRILPVFIRRGRESYGFKYEAEDLFDAVNKIETIWQEDLDKLITWDKDIKEEKKFYSRWLKDKLAIMAKPKPLKQLQLDF